MEAGRGGDAVIEQAWCRRQGGRAYAAAAATLIPEEWEELKVEGQRTLNNNNSYHSKTFPAFECFPAFLTVRSTRFAGRSSGLDAGFVSREVWFAVAGTGWGFRGMAPEDFTRSL